MLHCVMATGEGKKASDSVAVSGYWSGSHTVHRLRFHVVFVPKYRNRVLCGAIKARLEQLFAQACAVNDWYTHELSVQPDHVHLLIQIYPRESVASVVQRLKGGSSRVLRAEFPDLEEFLWGKNFWSSGYFVESVGVAQEEMVRRYIREQGRPESFPAPTTKKSGTRGAKKWSAQ